MDVETFSIHLPLYHIQDTYGDDLNYDWKHFEIQDIREIDMACTFLTGKNESYQQLPSASSCEKGGRRMGEVEKTKSKKEKKTKYTMLSIAINCIFERLYFNSKSKIKEHCHDWKCTKTTKKMKNLRIKLKNA